jgi:RNA polymerase sigma factor (sigma-70 family)
MKYFCLTLFIWLNLKQRAMTSQEFSNQLIMMEDHMEKFALSLTYNREEAKDLLQETYLKSLTYKDKFEEFTNLKAWVFTIMKNTFINNYRKSSRKNTNVDNTKDLLFLSNIKESELSMPDSEFAYQEIDNAINALENKFRLPFRMHNEGYKYKEIADNLNLKIGTVKNRIFSTRKKLMETLCDYQ